jgi:hypothetical protein
VKRLLRFEQQTTAPPEEKSFHWSTVREMLLLDADWQAKLRFQVTFQELRAEEKAEVRGELGCLLREDYAYILGYLP